MMRLRTLVIAAIALSLSAFPKQMQASAQTLDTFGVLGASTVTNTGPTTITGNLGLYAGSSVTGQASITLGGAYYISDPGGVALEAQNALIGLIDTYAVLPFTTDLTGQDLGVGGAALLTAGVYRFSSSAQITGTLTLDAQGDPNAVFIFQINSALTTASSSAVALINGAQGKNVYFVVGSDATLGTTTHFAGQILALGSITLNTASTIDCGAAWAHTGAVTLDTNVITTFCAFAAFGGVLGPTATANEQAVAAALDAFVTEGGTLPPAFQALLDLLSGLTPEQQAAAFAQLGGEAGTGAAQVGTQAMNSFLSQLFDSAFADSRAPSAAPDLGPHTVRTLGYAETDDPVAGAAFASLDKASIPRVRSVWATAYGLQGMTAGDSSIGSHDRFASAFGVASGFDYQVMPDQKAGFAFGAASARYSLSEGFGSGRTDMIQAAIYGRKDLGDAYVAAALAYAFNSGSTSRYLSLTDERFSAAFSAHNVAGEIEGGIRYGWLTPYAAVRAQAFYIPAYGESSSLGPSVYALDYAASTTTFVRTELGARLATTFGIRDGAKLALHGRIAWAHDFLSNSDVTAMFRSLPGSAFVVSGAERSADAVLASAGADVLLRNGLSIGGTFDGEFAENSHSYSGRARLRYAW